MIDQIAETIKETFRTQSSPAVSTVRPGEVLADNRQWRFWMTMPHVADVREGEDHRCLRCGLPDEDPVHALDKQIAEHERNFSPVYVANCDHFWSELSRASLLVERSESDAKCGAD
jgi:hypothetical protein